MTTETSIPNKRQKPIESGNFLENITVRQKLNMLIAVMTLGILAVFVISLRGAQTLRFHLSNMYDFMLVPITNITHAETELADIQVQLVGLSNGELSTTERSQYLETIKEKNESITTVLKKYETEWLTTTSAEFTQVLRDQNSLNLQADEVTTFSKLTTSFNKYLDLGEQLQQGFAAGTYNQEVANATLSALIETQNQLHHLVEVNNQFAALSNKAATSGYERTSSGLVLTLILAISIGFILSYNIARNTSQRLNIVESAAVAYQDGLLDLRSIINVGGNDEISRLAKAFNRLFSQMQETLVNLEARVHERTASLEAATDESKRRAKQFEAITLVGSAISSIRSLEDLMPKITELISEQFGYYHVGIFLNDANNENAILSAANSEGGKRMILRGHQLKIGQQGIVGFAISSGEARIALDVGEDAVYFGNPELPNTRSEIALPLKIGDTAVGALDVQSTEPSAFGDEDINVLSLLADQVSMAIENARLFDQARKSLAESEALYRQYLRQAWNRLPKEQNLAGFRYNARGASPIELKSREEGSGTVSKDIVQASMKPRISVPIEIRGEKIGTLDIHIPETGKISDNQLDLVNAVAERVALSAENARLFEETTRRAERERLVSDITVKIRSTNDPDAMIATALEELKQALGATKVQLVPHTLEKAKKDQQEVKPTPRLIGKNSYKRKRNKE